MNKYTKYFQILFDPGEYICAARTKYDTALIPVERVSTEPEWVTLNAHIPGTSRADKNVSVFRNILLEIDSLPVDEQQSYVQEIGLPYSVAVYSGGKSVHFIISLETPLFTKKEYDDLVWRIYKVVTKVDRAAKNCSRLTRNPGHYRKDKGKVQVLIFAKERVNNEVLYEWLDEQGAPKERPVRSKPSLDAFTLHGLLSPRTRLFLKVGAPEGQWNSSLFVAACDAKRCEYTEEEFISKAQKITGHLDEKDLATIRSAYLRED